jgi:hypothetical protein
MTNIDNIINSIQIDINLMTILILLLAIGMWLINFDLLSLKHNRVERLEYDNDRMYAYLNNKHASFKTYMQQDCTSSKCSIKNTPTEVDTTDSLTPLRTFLSSKSSRSSSKSSSYKSSE